VKHLDFEATTSTQVQQPLEREGQGKRKPRAKIRRPIIFLFKTKAVTKEKNTIKDT
jgi:hypothetical protein